MVNLVDSFEGELRVVKTLPGKFGIESIRIPLSDGTHLAARLWLPTHARQLPVPAIIEYIPYRQRDYTALRDGLIHPWFAGHGYAALRVDMRGSGDSTGIPMDEYVEQEQQDALEVLDYLSAQPWCTGATGMMGISWGGFNALQVAARRPPSLKAIITVCSTDDRYTDDVHYPGGCLVSDNLTWGTLGFANMGRPPDPQVVGEQWRDLWLERLKHSPFPLAEWLSHQTRDEYWKHGSVGEDFEAIECAVFAVGGWADSYTNAIARLMNGLSCPRRALIGPWVHAYPHLASPAPRVGFLQQATRWWDRWLKDETNGVEDEPRFTTFVQDSTVPKPQYQQRAGRWIEHDDWPPRGTRLSKLFLAEQRLVRELADEHSSALSDQICAGVTAGEWMALGAGPEMPLDQSFEDAGAKTFESEPLDDDVTFVGAPLITLGLTNHTHGGMVCARLSEVFPDGTATRVTYGVLNLCHRESHETPSDTAPGEPFTVQFQLNDFAQRVPRGNRLRLSISTSLWPMFWPAREPTDLIVHLHQCALELPVSSSAKQANATPEPAAIPSPPAVTWLRPVEHRRIIEQDRRANRTTLTYHRDEGSFRIEQHGMSIDSRGLEQHSIAEGSPTSASGHVRWRLALARGEWQTSVECEVSQTCSAEHFMLTMRLDAFEGDKRIFSRSEMKKIARTYL